MSDMQNSINVSACLCSPTKQKFIPTHIYSEGSIFTHYRGAIIGRCLNCGIHKTVKSPQLFEPMSSRPEMYELNKQTLIKELTPIVNSVIKYTKGQSILDVGASSGVLVELLLEKRYEIIGLEPNKKAYHRARIKKLPVYNCTLKEFIAKHPQKRFDCIIYNHVLEHVDNPNHELQLIHRVLHKKGVLILGVPNTRNLLFYLRGIYWESLMPGEHIWHFSDTYLKNLLEEHEFRTLQTFYTNHTRKTLSLMRRFYFGCMTLLNSLFHTGEAVTIIADKVTIKES